MADSFQRLGPGQTAKILLPDGSSPNIPLEPLPRLIVGVTTGGKFIPLNVSTTGAVVTTPSSGTARTPTLTAATSGATVAAGKKSVTFSSSSDFVGTILGASFGASQALVFAADGADTIGAIVYTVSGGTLYIATLT